MIFRWLFGLFIGGFVTVAAVLLLTDAWRLLTGNDRDVEDDLAGWIAGGILGVAGVLLLLLAWVCIDILWFHP